MATDESLFVDRKRLAVVRYWSQLHLYANGRCSKEAHNHLNICFEISCFIMIRVAIADTRNTVASAVELVVTAHVTHGTHVTLPWRDLRRAWQSDNSTPDEYSS